MKTKLTTELEVGDVIEWDDELDKILTIEKGMGVWNFTVERTFLDGREESPREAKSAAGVLAELNIAEFCPGCGSLDTDTNPVEHGECPVCICRRVHRSEGN